MLGFEFFHHDPLRVKEDKCTFKRRIERQLKYRGNRNFDFLYHHRITDSSDLSLLRAHLHELLSFYNVRGCECKVVLFYQNIIAENLTTRIDFIPQDSGLLEFICHTPELREAITWKPFGPEKMMRFSLRCLMLSISMTSERGSWPSSGTRTNGC